MVSSSKLANSLKALIMLFLLSVTATTAPVVVTPPISIHGVAIGMTRQEVERLHGPAYREEDNYCVFVTDIRTPIRVRYSPDNLVQSIPEYPNPDGSRTIYHPDGQKTIRLGDSRQIVENTLLARAARVEDGYDIYYLTERRGFEVTFEEGRVEMVTGRQLEIGPDILIAPNARQAQLESVLGDSELRDGIRYYPALGCQLPVGEFVDLISISAIK